MNRTFTALRRVCARRLLGKVAAIVFVATCAQAQAHTYHYSGTFHVKATSGPMCAFGKLPIWQLELFVTDARSGAVDGYAVLTTGLDHSTAKSPMHFHGTSPSSLAVEIIGDPNKGENQLHLGHIGAPILKVLAADKKVPTGIRTCTDTQSEGELNRIDNGMSVQAFAKIKQLYEFDLAALPLGALWDHRDFAGALPLVEHLVALTDRADGTLRDRKSAALTDLVLTQLAIGGKNDTLSLFEQATTLYDLLPIRRIKAITNVTLHAEGLGLGPQFEALLREAVNQEQSSPTAENLAAYQVALGTVLLRKDKAESLQWYRKAVARLPEDDPGLIDALDGVGTQCMNSGLYGEAYQSFQRALAIAEQQRAPVRDPLDFLIYIGIVLDRFDITEPNSQRACALAEANVWDKPHDYITECSTLAAVLYGEHKYDEADLYLRKLAAFDEILEPQSEGHFEILQQLGRNLVAQNKYEEAATVLERSLSFYDTQRGESLFAPVVALASLGDVELHQGQLAEARSNYQRAYLIERAEDSASLWRYATNLMFYYSDAQVAQPTVAIYYGKLAVNQLQSLRTGVADPSSGASDSKANESAFINGTAFVYRYLADLFISQGRLGEAQQVIGMLREQELFNFTQRDAASDPRKTALAMSEEENKALQSEPQLVNDMAELNALQAGAGATTTDPKAQARIAELERRTKDNQEIYVAALGEVSRAYAISGASMEKVHQLGMSFSNNLAILGHDSIMLQYLVLPEKLEIIVTTTGEPVVRTVKISRTDLYSKIEAYRLILQDPKRDPLKQAQELYEALIAPIAGDLQQLHAKVLMLSLDDALRYLPFAALYDGKHYLIEDYALSTVTLAAMNGITAPARPDWKVWGLGVTQAQDVTLGDEAHPQNYHFAALDSVAPELNSIAGAHGILPGSVLLDSGFTKDSLRLGLRQNYPVIHIASHFQFSPGNNSNSFLLLGDGPLTLEEMEKTFNFRSVDLLTLSACETALGDGRKADGTEVESFSSVVLNQGARAVLATLWSVSDSSTALLMRTLYENRQKGHMTKAQALQSAQLALLHGSNRTGDGTDKVRRAEKLGGPDASNAESFQVDPNAPYAHPYFWAPFVLTGNWL